MEFVLALGLFAAKTFLIVAAIIIVLLVIVSLAARGKSKPQLEVKKLNLRYKQMKAILHESLMTKKQWKAWEKQQKKEAKKDEDPRGRVFVLEFDGDIKASAVESLREEVTAVLNVATPQDEVVVRVESPGGMVHAYGLAASQLQRVRERKIPLTICVDKIAASGGYMMACIGDRILAAPFAIVGSIGVVANIPNFHRILEKNDVDYREVTAGEYKRTVSLLGEITPQGMEKFKEQIQETHDLFKAHVKHHRPAVDLARVATGEHWFGLQGIELNLVDEIRTSDDYILTKTATHDVYTVAYQERKKFMERLTGSVADASRAALQKLWSDVYQSRFGI